MVDDQDQYIDNIGTNVTTSRINVERGVEEIQAANVARKEQRARFFIVLGLILVATFLAIGGIIMAVFLPK